MSALVFLSPSRVVLTGQWFSYGQSRRVWCSLSLLLLELQLCLVCDRKRGRDAASQLGVKVQVQKCVRESVMGFVVGGLSTAIGRVHTTL